MNVLILGGSGFLGKHLIKSYSKNKNINIYTITRRPFEIDGIKEKYLGDVSNVKFLKASISRAKPKIIFYLISDFGHFKNEQLSYYLEKSITRIQNISSSISNNMKIVYVGSAAQYGKIKDPLKKVLESDNFNPISPYGLMKSFEEIQLMYLASAHNFNIVYARIFNLIGPGEPLMTFSGNIVSQLLKNDHVKHGNLYPERDFLDVRDAANALRYIASRGKKDTVYNICSGSGIKIGDLLNIIIETAGKKITLEKNTDLTRGAEIPKIIGSNKKLVELGWIQKFSLENSIKDLINYYLKKEK